jgi:predicted O-methyltransferase YrrM
MFGALLDGLKAANLHTLRLVMNDRQLAREYCSTAVQRYDELMRHGLPARSPLDFMYEEGWAPRRNDDRVELPINIHTGGGMRLDELLTLAMVTRVLRPAKVFEIGTFNGRTTSVLTLNSPAASRVVTLDLPPDVDADHLSGSGGIDTDIELIRQRTVGALVRELGLQQRVEQIFCDSLRFDPAPYRDSVELALIDGAHSLEHVRNDTEKMATMMAERGLVFWHDYGGKGRFRDLTEYLNRLALRIHVYRVAFTTLAWTPASELRKIAKHPPHRQADVQPPV